MNKNHTIHNYTIRPLFKITRLSFTISESRVASLFALVHDHVWVTIKKLTHDVNKYFLTRVTWIYLIVNKFDVVIALKEFIALIHNQFNIKVILVWITKENFLVII